MKKKVIYLVGLTALAALLLIGGSRVNAGEYTPVDPINLIGDNAGGWSDADCNVPSNSVVEIIACNPLEQIAIFGVRNTTDTQNRWLSVSEAEAGGNVTARFMINANATGFVTIYNDFSMDYYLVGYWQGVIFTERWQSISVGVGNDGAWYEYDASSYVLPDSVLLLTIYSDRFNAARLGGTRNTTSILNRYVDIHESEAGGLNMISMFVKSDSNAHIDLYSEDNSDVAFYIQGYFDNTLDFKEDWVNLDYNSPPSTWRDEDLSPYIDQDGRAVDIYLGHFSRDNEAGLGVRTDGDLFNRYIVEHEAESSGYNGFGITVNTSLSGIIETFFTLGVGGGDYFYFGGYFNSSEFIPFIPPTMGDVTRLYGVGLNETALLISNVTLRWNYTAIDVDFYEIQVSIDGISFIFLAYIPNTTRKEYIHINVLNGSNNWYRVRACKFKGGSWFNSSFSPINFERVMFALGGAAGPGPIIALSLFHRLTAFIWLAILLVGYVFEKYEMISINAILGIFLGLDLASESFIFLLFMFTANLWILYDSLYIRL